MRTSVFPHQYTPVFWQLPSTTGQCFTMTIWYRICQNNHQQYAWTRERLVFSLIWECGIILHVWGIIIIRHHCILCHEFYVFPWRRRSAFLLAMAVWVLEPNTAVVSPTSIPLREVLVLPDAETHITHRRQQHTPSRAQIIYTKCTAYACVICQKLFFSARVEMYCTCY